MGVGAGVELAWACFQAIGDQSRLDQDPQSGMGQATVGIFWEELPRGGIWESSFQEVPLREGRWQGMGACGREQVMASDPYKLPLGLC